MKILFFSYAFAPDVGGLETVSALLAERFARAGHEIKLITNTPAPPGFDAAAGRPFEVVRRPAAGVFVRLMRWCDLYFQNNISLNALWPLLLAPRPWAVAHHSWLADPAGRPTLRDYLKRCAVRLSGCSIAVSRALAGNVGRVDAIISNPYDDGLFRVLPGVERELRLVFLGRLIPGKGLDELLGALVLLRDEHDLCPPLTVVGSGPEEMRLRARVAALGLTGQVDFHGTCGGEELVRLLNRHEIMVVPSVFPESFGVVALEGIACGCVIVGTHGGGLAEAVGACGLKVLNGGVHALACALRHVLTNPALRASLRAGARAHLAPMRAGRVAGAYLALLEKVGGRGREK